MIKEEDNVEKCICHKKEVAVMGGNDKKKKR